MKTRFSKTIVRLTAASILAGSMIGIAGPAQAQTRAPVKWSIQGTDSNADVSNPELSNPELSNPDVSSPPVSIRFELRDAAGSSNPDVSNPELSNPMGPQEAKDCYWFKGRLYCIYYGM